MTYNPEIWAKSLVRELKAYVEDGFNNAVLNNLNNPVGNQVYDVVMEFPPTEMIVDMLPGTRTIVHFEIDDIVNRPLGFGKPVSNYNYDGVQHWMKPQEAKQHNVNFDVGIWTWDKAGGTTKRLEALEILSDLFQGWKAQEQIDASADGGDGRIEILRFEGGRFLTDKINDINVYRTVNGQLDVRVFSRTKLPPDSEAIPTIETVLENPQLDISGNPIT